MTACLRCAASGMDGGSRIKVWYNSSRSDTKQVVEGKVTRVYYENCLRVIFVRDDGQKMEIHDTKDKLVSFGSHFPNTGFAYRYEIK